MSNVADFLGGSLIGGLPNWVLVLLIAIGLFGGVFARWGDWLTEHGRIARSRCDEKIASHRADELQDRMLVLEDRIGKRAEKLPKELHPVIARLDKSTEQINQAATYLADINIEEAAERSFRQAMPQMESARGLSKLEKNIAQTTGRTIREKLAEVRPALSILKQEAPRLKVDAGKLHDVDAEFNQTVDEVNKTFEEFENIVRSEDRTKIAARASIVVPWLIAVLITGIALSGVFLNFFLIERPMSEIVGEGSRIAGVGLPAFAAMIVIFLEFVAGVVLMDALGFTKLIPAFHTMPDSGRKILLIGALIFLAAFSVLEAFLAIVREQIIEQNNEISRIAVSQLGGAAAAAPGDVVASTVPTAKVAGIALPTFAQIILAVVIPWLLATAALPLETIVRNSVFMVSIVTSYALLALGFIFRSLGAPSRTIGQLFGGGGSADKEDRRAAKADKADERAARKLMKKNKKDEDDGGPIRQEDDLMVFEELPQDDVQPNRRDKRQRELKSA